MKRILGIILLAFTIGSTAIVGVASAAEPADQTADSQSVVRPGATAYAVIGQVGAATVDAFALQRKRTGGTVRVFDPTIGYFTGVVGGANQESDGTVRLAGRGRLLAGGGKPTAVRYVLTANPTTKAVSLELTKIAGGASAGKLSGTLTNGLIRAEKLGVKQAPRRP
jgi:hypothetical protein